MNVPHRVRASQLRWSHKRSLMLHAEIEQPRGLQSLVDHSNTVWALRVVRAHFMVGAVGVRDVGEQVRHDRPGSDLTVSMQFAGHADPAGAGDGNRTHAISLGS